MKRLGLKYVAPKDYSKYIDTESGAFDIRNTISLDVSRLKYRNEWTPSTHINQENLPSSLILNENIINKGIPTLSVVIDNYDLYDQATGIFRNYLKKGRNWERPCFISYYDNGNLLFATGAGVRVHGGKSRKNLVKSIRLYFRNIYGFDKFKSGILFDKTSDPLKHLVVRSDTGGGFYFTNLLPYDISRRIGCIAPLTKPVKLHLNGSVYGHGNFLLIEHVSREYFISHFGHDDFIFFRTKGRKERPAEYDRIVSWAKDHNFKMTMRDVEKYINIDNFSRWWISQLFCANSDSYQGIAFLDKRKQGAKWSWINWDMDHCIRNRYETDIKNLWEQRLNIHQLMNKSKKVATTDLRAILFRRLNIEDPEYRKYFRRLLMDILNHRLTPEYLESRVLYYERTAKSFGIKKLGFIRKTREFFKHRHAFLMKLLKKCLHYPDYYSCMIRSTGDAVYKIDGYIHKRGYRGWYFKGSQITVEIANDKSKGMSYWLINGRKVKNDSAKLTYTINSDTTIGLVNPK